MPTYEYRCEECQELTTVVCNVTESRQQAACDHCCGTARKIISRVAVRLSNTSKMEKLDPKYDKMVDRAMQNTPSADPDSYLKRMKPFSDKKT
jgi:putative FmdB family regulatory protein